jgi:hypothetical protein
MHVYKFSFISNECCTIISFIRILLVFLVFDMFVGGSWAGGLHDWWFLLTKFCYLESSWLPPLCCLGYFPMQPDCEVWPGVSACLWVHVWTPSRVQALTCSFACSRPCFSLSMVLYVLCAEQTRLHGAGLLGVSFVLDARDPTVLAASPGSSCSSALPPLATPSNGMGHSP